MKRIRIASSIVFSIVVSLMSPIFPAAADETQEWRFTALLDGKKIGYQNFELTRQGETKVLVSEAQYKVKILFVNVYSYHHNDREVWHGDCLTQIESRTNDNGEKLQVNGAMAQSQLVVDTGEQKQQLSGCVKTFAYWNPHILDAVQLLNSQTGEYMKVNVTDRGAETIEAAGQERDAHRYTLATDKFTIDLWYSPNLDWLGLETTTESGRRLRYVLK